MSNEGQPDRQVQYPFFRFSLLSGLNERHLPIPGTDDRGGVWGRTALPERARWICTVIVQFLQPTEDDTRLAVPTTQGTRGALHSPPLYHPPRRKLSHH